MSHSTHTGSPGTPSVGIERPVVVRPHLSLIAAVASNGVIGARGQLPWHLPEDLRHFKSQTAGHPVLMGRRTWESIGKPLAGRENIVVTRQTEFNAPGARTAASLEAALRLCAGASRVYVIGGSALYEAALPLADELVITELHAAFEGDTTFPEFDRTEWRETRRERGRSADGIGFDFVWYARADRSVARD